jgi:hypothetical protein
VMGLSVLDGTRQMKVRKLQDKKAITFPTFCKFCDRNGANHQEYGRLCPNPGTCLLTGKPKSETGCPRWRRLRLAYSIEQVEVETGGKVDGTKHACQLHVNGEVEV